MKQMIINMIEDAKSSHDEKLIYWIKVLIRKFSDTMNCPSDWRDIGRILYNMYFNDNWVFESLELWDYEE